MKNLMVGSSVLYDRLPSSDRSDDGESIDDSYITSAVKTQLASDKLVSLTRVKVETNNGIVYLTGQVQTAEQRSHIGSIASQVKGVKRVVNNLQVINR